MDKIFKLLRMAFNVIIFFIAITLLYTMFQQYKSLTDNSADIVAEDNMMYEAYIADTTHYITRSELIALLLGDLEYDIEVMDVSGIYNIIAKGYNPSDIGVYVFKSNNYKKTYIYKLDGMIKRIKYQYVTG
jgi:hypothetical protein